MTLCHAVVPLYMCTGKVCNSQSQCLCACGFPCLVQEAQAEHDAGAGQAQGEGHPDTGQAGLLNCYSIQKIQSTLFFMN